MIVLLYAVLAGITGVFGAHADDFVCKHQEWTAHHMQEQLGWSLKKGRRVAAQQCRQTALPLKDEENE